MQMLIGFLCGERCIPRSALHRRPRRKVQRTHLAPRTGYQNEKGHRPGDPFLRFLPAEWAMAGRNLSPPLSFSKHLAVVSRPLAPPAPQSWRGMPRARGEHLATRQKADNSPGSDYCLLRASSERGTASGSFGKLQIGRVDRATEVLVIEPDKHAACVYRRDDAVPVASLRRPVDYAASAVGLLGMDHCSVPFLGACKRCFWRARSMAFSALPIASSRVMPSPDISVPETVAAHFQ